MKKETIDRIRRFTEDRDWDQFHTLANLAKSISIEANELLECFQWSDTEYDLDHVREELADVIVYCQNMLDKLRLDVDEIGKRINIFRKRSRLTMKALGMFLGFKDSNADVRISQYETGLREPRRKVISAGSKEDPVRTCLQGKCMQSLQKFPGMRRSSRGKDFSGRISDGCITLMRIQAAASIICVDAEVQRDL